MAATVKISKELAEILMCYMGKESALVMLRDMLSLDELSSSVRTSLERVREALEEKKK